MLGRWGAVARGSGCAEIGQNQADRNAQRTNWGAKPALWATVSAAALIAGLTAGPRGALADCVVDAGATPDTITCTAADNNGVDHTTADDDLTIQFNAGSSVNNAAGHAVRGRVDGTGDNLEVLPTPPGVVITSTGGDGLRLRIRDPHPTNSIVVQPFNGTITAVGGDGIHAVAPNGSIAITVGPDGFIQSQSDNAVVGRIAGDGNVTLVNNGELRAGNVGLRGVVGGTGLVDITNNGSIGTDTTPVGGDGIVANGNDQTAQGTGAKVVNTGSIFATETGIRAVTEEAGIDIDSTGSIKAETGIFAESNGGVVDVTTGTGGTVDFSGFAGMAAINWDGNAVATVGDKITYSPPGGLGGFSVGALAVAAGGGNATVNVNAAIDPPLIGAATFTFGAGTATTNINALTQATGVGAFAGNFGDGAVAVNVAGPNGAIESDGIGVLTLNFGDGDSTVSLDGSVGGDTAAATGGEGVLMLGFGNTGNMSLTSTVNGIINAGDDAVEIVKEGGGGTIAVGLNANATGGDEGVQIYRTLSGPNAGGANNISVGIGQTSPMTLTAGTGDGIEIDTPFAHNDIGVTVGAGSSVLADDGSAIEITGFSLLGDNAVNVQNAGTLRGEGSLFDPTVYVETDGAVEIHNQTGGLIQSDGGNAFASIIQSYSGDTNTVTNDGTMTGSVQLFSFNGNRVTNNSSNTWNTAGLNLFLSGGANVLDNTAPGSINTGPLTAFLFIGPDNDVNNAGVINVNQNADSFLGLSLTAFAGLPGQNLEFNNAGGLLNMSNGVSDFGLVTPATVPGFIGGPLGPYENGIGDITFIGGNFNGGPDSQLGIDAFLDASATSSSDLLVVGFPGSGGGRLGTGDTTGETGIVVNDLNGGPGSYNPNGILVVDVEGDSPAGSFFLAGGPIDKGLFDYDLYRLEVGSVDWILASTPGARAFELPKLISGAQEVWHQSAGVWLDRTADLRSMYGTAAVYGGPQGPAPAYVGLPPDKGASTKDVIPAYGASYSASYSVWGRGFGADYDVDADHTVELFGVARTLNGDYSQDVFGGQAGIDVVVSKTARSTFIVGALGGFATSDMKFDTTGDKATLDGPMAGIYATYLKGPWFVDVLGMGQWLDTDFETTFQGATAKTDIESYGVVVDTGYRFGGGGGMFIEPMGTLAWLSTEMDAFDLLGAGVDPDDGESLLGRVGLRVGTQFVSGGHRIEPFVVGSLWNEFEGDNSVQLSSAGFVLPIAHATDGSYGEVGGGVNIFSTRGGFSAFAKGDVRIGDDVEGVSGKAGVRFTW